MCRLTLFFFTYTPPTAIYTLSLHDALPILPQRLPVLPGAPAAGTGARYRPGRPRPGDRKSTRLNSSHLGNSYVVFCLKKKKIFNIMLPPFTLMDFGRTKQNTSRI